MSDLALCLPLVLGSTLPVPMAIIRVVRVTRAVRRRGHRRVLLRWLPRAAQDMTDDAQVSRHDALRVAWWSLSWSLSRSLSWSLCVPCGILAATSAPWWSHVGGPTLTFACLRRGFFRLSFVVFRVSFCAVAALDRNRLHHVPHVARVRVLLLGRGPRRSEHRASAVRLAHDCLHPTDGVPLHQHHASLT